MDIQTIKFMKKINKLSQEIKNGIIPLSEFENNKNQDHLIVYDDKHFEDYKECNKKAYGLVSNFFIDPNNHNIIKCRDEIMKGAYERVFISDNFKNYYIIISLFDNGQKLNIIIKKDGSWDIISEEELHSIKNFKEEEIIEKTEEVEKVDKVVEVLSKIHMITASCLFAVILAKILQIYQM